VTRVLIVDDDRAFARALEIGLTAHGYEVLVAHDGAEGIVTATRERPEVVLLDLGLPGYSGMEVLETLRTWSEVPVIVLSARHQSAAKVAALDAGADDYLTKPFGIDELLARIRAAVRRAGPDPDAGIITAGDVRIDLATRRTTRGDVEIHLTPKEWGVVATLARAQGRVVPQAELLTAVWGPGYETESEYLRSVMLRIRRKLEADPSTPRHFVTAPGAGYRFVA
jgi:two-component system, OmpR family, KDP operon response regulator KdpE